ncbi:MAG: hypothetical protein ABSA79_01485 [Candidatus Bathyarchaeia archaeon]
MINESQKDVKAYWFFTPLTLPDRELLALLDPQKHEVGLHVVNDPFGELERLEKVTGRVVKYYSIHGTARLFARIMWRRKLGEAQAKIPSGFPLKSFHDFPTTCLDTVCYANPCARAMEIAEKSLSEGKVLEIHPEWLFQRGTINHRGPYYEALKKILDVDKDIEKLAIGKKAFVKIATDPKEYERSVIPNSQLLEKLSEKGVDIFNFVERGWVSKIPNPPSSWVKTEDNVALLNVSTFGNWWEDVGKKTRNMVRKAEKAGIETKVTEPDGNFAEGVWKIYNETPIRQARAFPYYGITKQTTEDVLKLTPGATFIAAFFQDEVVGFLQLIHGDNINIVGQILSMQKLWDKAINNALLAKAVEVTAEMKGNWLMYGRIGNHPSLDDFKQSNGFTKFPLTRFYIPITAKGRLATKLGLHRKIKDSLPITLRYRLIPLFNWVSRTKIKARMNFHKEN